MPKDYPRSDRISQQIKKEIADILSIEIKDPALKSVSIIDVEVAHDFKKCKSFLCRRSL
jgi:ribosome-binding factor A